MLYKYKLAEVIKNICCVSDEGTADQSTVPKILLWLQEP